MLPVRQDNTLYDEEQTITPVRNDSGEITHFVAIKLDVTDRNRAHAELVQRLQELTALNHLFQEHLTRRDELEGNLAACFDNGRIC